jgi:hypothetical protein
MAKDVAGAKGKIETARKNAKELGDKIKALEGD